MSMKSVLVLLLALAGPCFAGKQDICNLNLPLVVNGTALNCSVPWLASLRTISDTHFCGGSLITPRVVLTAAHCIAQNGNPATVDIGRVDRMGDDGSGFETKIVSHVIMHEDYDKGYRFDNDIALVVLSSKSNKKLASLAPSDFCFHTRRGCSLRLLGWGSRYFGGPLSDTLETAVVRTETPANCIHDYEVLKGNVNVISSTMICAKGNGTDACGGDSGGPLLMKSQVVGIVSFGYDCAAPNAPGVYASVPRLRPWIIKKLAEISPVT